jgi:F-type H+-transporting ATPase subunit b
MGDISAAILAASQAAGEGGQSNFLIPNGTFFFVLIIFLIVLGVIGTFVVPPISKVLRERESMVKKTAEDNRQSAEQLAAAQADYQKAMTGARGKASAIRNEARAEGRQIVEDMRARSSAESAATLQKADERLSEQGRETAAELQASIQTLSATLASRVLGVDMTSGSAGTPVTSGQGR